MHLVKLYVPLPVLNSLPTGGKCGGAYITVYGCVFGTLFLIGVALLGWSSFEFDTIQGNGWCIFVVLVSWAL